MRKTTHPSGGMGSLELEVGGPAGEFPAIFFRSQKFQQKIPREKPKKSH